MEREHLRGRLVRAVLTALVVGAGLLAAGCGGSGPAAGAGKGIYTGGAPGGVPAKGGTLVFARTADPVQLDPALSTDLPSVEAILQMFDQLVEYLPGSTTPQPGLATSWTISPDYLTFDFTLRQGVRFSDGTPVTAEDVKFSVERFKLNGNVPQLGTTITSVKILSPSKVRIQLAQPSPAYLDFLGIAQASIIPEHVFKRVGAKAFANAPVGSGAFKLRSWDRGNRLELVRNRFYWRAGMPYLDGVTFQVVADSNARILGVESGQTNVADNVPFSQTAALAANPKVRMLVQPVASTSTELFNDGRAPFTDKRVRLALNYATPRRQLVQAVYRGYAVPANGALPPTPFTDKSIPVFPYDLGKARQLLRSSSHPNGFRLTIGVASEDPDLKIIASTLQASWAKIGVRASIRLFDTNTLVTNALAGNYDFIVLPSDAYTTDILASDETGTIYDISQNHASASFYDSPLAQKLVRQALVETDQAKRLSLWHQLQRLTYLQDAAYLPIGYLPARTLLSRDVHALTVLPNAYIRLDRVFLKQG